MIKVIGEKAYAKVNLTLDIVKRLDNGYHEIASVMHKIGLYDCVFVSKVESGGIDFSCAPEVCDKEDNLSYIAAKAMVERYGIRQGIKVDLEKNIPCYSGLGGGSSDAAATIRAIGRLFPGVCVSDEDKYEISELIGSDVGFCLSDFSAAVANGTGNKIKGIASRNKFYGVIAKPDFGVCTKMAYEGLDYSETGKKNSTERMADAVEGSGLERIASEMHNDFEFSVFRRFPKIRAIKESMVDKGALNAVLCGSGSAVFGIAKDEDSAIKVYEGLKAEKELLGLDSAFVCRSV